MGSLDPAKILVILIIALIVIGPERLPKAARQLGGAWRELTKIRQQVTDEVRSVIPEDVVPHFGSPSSAVSNFISDVRSDLKGAIDGTKAPADETAASEADDVADVTPPVIRRVSAGEFTPDDASMN